MLALLALTDTQREAVRQKLDESLPELSSLISLDSVLKLVDAFGGQDVYVPRKETIDSKLGNVIGTKDLSVLRDYYKGSHIKIPRLMPVRRMLRNQEISEVRTKGAAINEIAAQFDLTERQILNILRKRR